MLFSANTLLLWWLYYNYNYPYRSHIYDNIMILTTRVKSQLIAGKKN